MWVGAVPVNSLPIPSRFQPVLVSRDEFSGTVCLDNEWSERGQADAVARAETTPLSNLPK